MSSFVGDWLLLLWYLEGELEGSFLELFGSVGDHLGEVLVLFFCHFVEPAISPDNESHVFGGNSKHNHVVAEGGQLAENDVFLPQHGLRQSFSFLFGEHGHLFVCGFEDGCFPEVIPLPDLRLIDLGTQVKELFIFVVHPVVGENETENTPDDEGIILFLTLSDNYPQHFGTSTCAAAVLYHHFQLNPILLQEYKGY